jgi:hypothetical protein
MPARVQCMNKESMAMKHTHHTTHVYYTMVQQPRSYASQVWCFVNSGFSVVVVDKLGGPNA